MDQNEQKTKINFSEKSVNKTEKFLKANYKILIGIGVAIIVILIALTVVLNINNSKTEANYLALDDLNNAYSALLLLDVNTDEYKNAVAAFNSDADALIISAKNSYPSFRAEFIKAELLASNEEYAEALKIFEGLYDKTKNLYLGPLSLINAAALADNLGDTNKAILYYSRVWDVYGNKSPVSAKALFNLGRLYEESNDIELAKANYQQLIDEFQNPEKGTDTEYARLAKNRLAVL